MNYSLRRIEDATEEPITLDEAKAHVGLPLSYTEEDERIQVIIKASRYAIEHYLGRVLGEQTWELGLREWPVPPLEFPRPPLIEMLSCKYACADGETRVAFDKTASPAVPWPQVNVDNSGDPGELWLTLNGWWPIEMLATGFPIHIQYTCGLVEVPENIKQAMLLMISHLNENREAVTLLNTPPQELPFGVKALLSVNLYQEMR